MRIWLILFLELGKWEMGVSKLEEGAETKRATVMSPCLTHCEKWSNESVLVSDESIEGEAKECFGNSLTVLRVRS
jgi:hypothetical protein